jgi:molybdenum cofactor sulfurtransferase
MVGSTLFARQITLIWEVHTFSFTTVLILDTIYMDHAGATPYPISSINAHAKDLTSTLLSNPHSQSASAIETDNRIKSIRLRILQLFNASPKLFDVVFVPNATGGIKLVADGFSATRGGFRYRYLRDAHTSLLGVTGLAKESGWLTEDDVTDWIRTGGEAGPGLLAYPAQSNFNGRRFPLHWPKQLRETRQRWYSLLDASSILTTTPLDYSDTASAPDFTVMSFYKIFGYPDLGAVIVRKDVGHMLVQRRYFGGGTRNGMTVDAWHVPRTILHEALEDGTLPFHTIMALETAFNTHIRLFGSHIRVARHASVVAQFAITLLSSLQHQNGRKVCHLYSVPGHGPIVSFNIFNPDGTPVGFVSFDKLCVTKDIAVRTGGMCNPGAMQSYIGIPSDDLLEMFDNGKICGDAQDIIGGRNIGAIRASFGACSSVEDVCALVDLIREVYVK